MKRSYLIIIIIVVVAALAVGGYYMFKGKSNYSNQGSSNQSTTPQATNTVSIKDFAFNPNNITVKAGTTVTWQNNDSTTHSIKSDTFSSPDIAPGSSYQFTFNTAGSYPYHCGIHPTMTGTVTVQ